MRCKVWMHICGSWSHAKRELSYNYFKAFPDRCSPRSGEKVHRDRWALNCIGLCARHLCLWQCCWDLHRAHPANGTSVAKDLSWQSEYARIKCCLMRFVVTNSPIFKNIVSELCKGLNGSWAFAFHLEAQMSSRIWCLAHPCWFQCWISQLC